MTRPSGERKYPTLMKLARIALTLNHGNADIERGFSKNKLMVASHRTRLSMPRGGGTGGALGARAPPPPHFSPQSMKCPTSTGVHAHRRIQDFVRGGGKALLAPGGGGKALLPPPGSAPDYLGEQFLWGGGGGAKAPLAPPPWIRA